MDYGFAAIGQILDAVAGAGGAVSSDFHPVERPTVERDRFRIARAKRSALASSIADAFMWRDTYRELWCDRRAKARYQDLATVSKIAKQLTEIMGKNEGELTRMLSNEFPGPREGTTLGQGLAVMSALVAAADAKRAELEASGASEQAFMNMLPSTTNEPGGWDNAAKASDVFILGLQDAYREFFGEPTIHQDIEGEPYGPFVAFVQAIRRLDDDPVTNWAVKKAADRARSRGRAGTTSSNLEKPSL